MRTRYQRKSGWQYPDPTVPKKELIKNNLFLEPYYDEWENFRDGTRSPFDRTKIRKESTKWAKNIKKDNNKLRKLNSRRKSMKYLQTLKKRKI